MLDPLGVEASAASTDCFGGKAGERREQGGGDGGVADADLAEHDQVAALGEFAGKRVTGFDRGPELFDRQCRPDGDVCGSGGDAPIGQSG